MFHFLENLRILFSGIFAREQNNHIRPQHGYYEGDDSPWIITDGGPRKDERS